ncbi:right-handed parallel beta-helix repeat-containing protein [Flavobacterium sp. 3HN19-14]|uniref:right-handed parallel beta-helix repeat-containing protein n=1 Tax=Flavobacterium sp. 3HN19-14 TaxID=3448133 RepID=UPI003EE00411
MTVTGTTISGNSAAGAGADQGGGGIYNLNSGTLSITNATITDNDATGTLGSGGGILNDVGSQLTVTNSVISGNTAVRAGGGIEDNSGTSTIILTDVTLNGNSVSRSLRVMEVDCTSQVQEVLQSQAVQSTTILQL